MVISRALSRGSSNGAGFSSSGQILRNLSGNSPKQEEKPSFLEPRAIYRQTFARVTAQRTLKSRSCFIHRKKVRTIA
ncbi:MAG: hypothetical protein DMF37_02680 [Verrucomicrobia bacterium]|nr:MAG: hypothetical protein DMF37_02680 [Verrucomicrobiota bacterium]